VHRPSPSRVESFAGRRAEGQPDEAAPERAGPPRRASDAATKLGGAGTSGASGPPP
jgi:hypothetical protein